MTIAHTHTHTHTHTWGPFFSGQSPSKLVSSKHEVELCVTCSKECGVDKEAPYTLARLPCAVCGWWWCCSHNNTVEYHESTLLAIHSLSDTFGPVSSLPVFQTFDPSLDLSLTREQTLTRRGSHLLIYTLLQARLQRCKGATTHLGSIGPSSVQREAENEMTHCHSV
jgi:hypothetical protein